MGMMLGWSDKTALERHGKGVLGEGGGGGEGFAFERRR